MYILDKKKEGRGSAEDLEKEIYSVIKIYCGGSFACAGCSDLPSCASDFDRIGDGQSGNETVSASGVR